jgi:phage replication initiation protein
VPRSGFPPALTGGESPSAAPAQAQRVKPDWLTYTVKTDPEVIHALEHLDLLRSVLGPNVTAVDCPGILGYLNGIRYFVNVGDESIPVARLDWGGSQEKGYRARFDLSGAGCSKVTDWPRFTAFIGRQFDYTITRIDLAFDLFNGEYTVEDCVDWYAAGDFTAGGRNPSHSMPGDWLKPQRGRTFEVGRRANGKMLRSYEKGRQLGDPDSAWTRFEVEFRNVDRDLNLDMLIECDRYFAGAYRCLLQVLEAVPLKVPTHQPEGEISLAHLAKYCRTAYGKAINVIRIKAKAEGVSDEEILSSLTINGVPARLEKAAVGGFLESPSPAKEQP